MDGRTEDALLTIKEVAERLKVSEATVDRWIRSGDLRATDLNAGMKKRRILRVRESALDLFTRRGETIPPVQRRTRRAVAKPKRQWV